MTVKLQQTYLFSSFISCCKSVNPNNSNCMKISQLFNEAITDITFPEATK